MLMSLIKKIKSYKNSLVLVVALNLFFLALGGLLTWNYFKVYSSQKQELKLILERQAAAIQLLAVDSENKDFNSQFVALKNAAALGYELDSSEKKSTNQLSKRISQWKLQAVKDLEEISLSLETYSHQLDQIRQELLWASLFATLFGLILPALLFFLIGKVSLQAKRTAEDKVKLWVHDWHQSKNGHEDPFKNPQFWMSVALLTSDHFLSEMDNPYYSYIGKISREIRSELNQHKSKSNKSTEKKESDTVA